MSFVFIFLFFVLSPSLWSLCVFPSQICGDGVDVGWELCWGSMGLCGLILVVGDLLSWVHVFGVISVVLMSVLVWSCWVWGLFMVCFLVIVVWAVTWGVDHALLCCVCVSSFVSVICAIVVFRFLVSPILVNHFCCCAISFDCCFRERSDWKEVVVSSSGSSSSVSVTPQR